MLFKEQKEKKSKKTRKRPDLVMERLAFRHTLYFQFLCLVLLHSFPCCKLEFCSLEWEAFALGIFLGVTTVQVFFFFLVRHQTKFQNNHLRI